jgi:arginine N-succinyltransferase
MSDIHHSNYVVRAVQRDDLDDLQNVATSLRGSMTSLPKDRDYLKKKIWASLRAFDPLVQSAGSDNYLFVLEDVKHGVLVGTSGILARIGGFDPFYSYCVRYESVRHDPLGILEEMPSLHLEKSYKGPSEVCSLLLRPDHCHAGLGRLLSLVRFVFMASFPSRFETTVIAELRGVVDEEGRSPFWEAVVRPFFKQDFQTADFWSGLGHKQFIEDLMPKYPIYIPLLPKAAQDVIGKVHPRATPAFRILQQEGFVKTSQVDIFDAGPLLRAPLRGIRTVNETRKSFVKGFRSQLGEKMTHIIARPSLEFRACLGEVEEDEDDGLFLPSYTEKLLGLAVGDLVHYVSFSRQKLNQ